MIRLLFVLFLASSFAHAKKQEESHCQGEINNTELHQQVLEAMKGYRETVHEGDYVLAIASRNGYIVTIQPPYEKDDHSEEPVLQGVGNLTGKAFAGI